MITDYDVCSDISGRKEYFDVNVSVKHLCFMLYVDCTCNYAPLQVCRNVQKPTIRARNRFQPREKTFIIIPTFESECPGFFKCGNIWRLCIAQKFIIQLRGNNAASLLKNEERKTLKNVQHFTQWRNHICPLHH